jgi:glyoxylase-like metal-dependent hydrolase (beta-lactamase superfamily II)
MSKHVDGIRYEFSQKPEFGAALDVAPGLKWLRMPLPIVLEHINLWIFEDADGWTLVDTGLFVDRSCEIWERAFTDIMHGRRAERVIVTHLHPDHLGCAGWLAERFDADLWMTREEYLLGRILVDDTGQPAPSEGIRFYSAAGFSSDALNRYRERFGSFGNLISRIPQSYRRLKDNDLIRIGDYDWQVIVGRGHSPEHACLYCPDMNVLISGDQVLPTISSNVSVYPTEPEANPLADWMASLASLRDRLPADVLVLPAHGRPFRNCHARLDQLRTEHESGLANLLELCSTPQRAIDVFPALFKSRITAGNLIMATGESVAHLNYLVDQGELAVTTDENGIRWYSK